jgi:hypothetical protein
MRVSLAQTRVKFSSNQGTMYQSREEPLNIRRALMLCLVESDGAQERNSCLYSVSSTGVVVLSCSEPELLLSTMLQEDL